VPQLDLSTSECKPADPQRSDAQCIARRRSHSPFRQVAADEPFGDGTEAFELRRLDRKRGCADHIKQPEPCAAARLSPGGNEPFTPRRGLYPNQRRLCRRAGTQAGSCPRMCSWS
jgi:hypothetical protein